MAGTIEDWIKAMNDSQRNRGKWVIEEDILYNIRCQGRSFGRTHAQKTQSDLNYRFYDIIKCHAIDMVWSATENAYVESKSKLKFY